jgi:capsular polysaccharide transport system ATP-binding protein
MKDASGIFVSHSMPQVKEMCDIGVILEKGQLSYYDDIDEAIAQHNANIRGHNG